MTTAPWIDTHAHLDVWSRAENEALKELSLVAQVAHCVIPAVSPENFDTVRELAHALDYSYALGIHPLYIEHAADDALQILQQHLKAHQHDARLVAVGEIGLDFFVPALNKPALRDKQIAFYRAQLKTAAAFGLPVLLHVRKSVDVVLKGLREISTAGGIAHAFNGSQQQAEQLLQLHFKLGFGGALTYTRALHLQELMRSLPAHAIVMETDSPDIPPSWLYTTAQDRAQGKNQTANTPDQLARIGAFAAQLRGVDVEGWQQQCWVNTLQALPKLKMLVK